MMICNRVVAIERGMFHLLHRNSRFFETRASVKVREAIIAHKKYVLLLNCMLSTFDVNGFTSKHLLCSSIRYKIAQTFNKIL